MIKIVSDFDPAAKTGRGTARKSFTFEAKDSDEPRFKIKRVIRSLIPSHIRDGLLTSGLSLPHLDVLIAKRELFADSLLAWPSAKPLLKFSLHRWTNVYWLSAIDQDSTDSYMLKTPRWPQVSAALTQITAGAVTLDSPAILNIYNPFAAYAPFTTPSGSDFEKENSRLQSLLEAEATRLLHSGSAGILSPKLAAEYLHMAARLETLRRLIPPSEDDFELEFLEL